MRVEVIQDKIAIVRVHENVEMSEIGKLRTAIEEAFRLSPKGFIIDLSEVEYIDSAGISSLVFAYRKLTAAGGKLAVIAVHNNVKRVLKITRLDALPDLFIYDNIPNAELMLEAA